MNTTSEPDDESQHSASGLIAERARRIEQLNDLRNAGVNPYPYRFDRTDSLDAIRARHNQLEAGTETTDQVAVAGRIMLKRDQGKLIFCTLKDRSGDIQLFISKSVVGDETFDAINEFDLGDWIGVSGVVMTTRKGELSVKVTSAQLLSKAIRPLPDKWHGLTDIDTRYRQRYADLIINEEARRTFEVRHATISSFRRTLNKHDYIEVETPVLHVESGGANARPFVTHHNALDMQMYLRVALELHLKRLIVGGMERVYEIGRVFRNEGISTRLLVYAATLIKGGVSPTDACRIMANPDPLCLVPSGDVPCTARRSSETDGPARLAHSSGRPAPGGTRPWQYGRDIGGKPGTIIHPFKTTFHYKTFYRSSTQVSQNWISVINFFVNAFGEWETGSEESIKMGDTINIPRN